MGGAVAAWSALATLSLAGRAVVGPPLGLIAVLTALPWLWLGLTAALSVVAIGRRSRTLAALAGATGLLWLSVWGRAWAPWPDRAAAGEPLRILSWNVQRLGWEDADASPRLDCVAQEVSRQDPDAVAFLEVSARDVERLSARLGLDCVQVDYRGTGGAGRGGLAACARGARWKLGENSPRRFADDIDWYYVFAELVPQGGGPVFNLLTVHLQPHGLLPGQPDRVVEHHQRETEALLDRMSRLRDPTVLAGDFNSARDAAIHARLRHTLTDTWERAGLGPGFTVQVADRVPLRIDYIYATPTFGVTDARISAADCSDHRPVVADLVLRAP